MTACFVSTAHAVEQEGVDVVVQCLVIEEELAQQTEVATPGSLTPAVDFEEGNVVIAVDFVSGWVHEGAFGTVTLEGALVVEVSQAELVNVYDVCIGERCRVWREVPRLDIVFAHLETGQVSHTVNLRRVLGHTTASA